MNKTHTTYLLENCDAGFFLLVAAGLADTKPHLREHHDHSRSHGCLHPAHMCLSNTLPHIYNIHITYADWTSSL